MKFYERHFRRLHQHVAQLDPDGIANFLHIALAIGAVLRLQIERAVDGLEVREVISTDEWADFRGNCDVYFSFYREMATLIWNEYLTKMARKSRCD